MTKVAQRLLSAHTMVTEHLSICSSYAILLRHIFRLISSLVDPHRINRSYPLIHSFNYRNIFKSSNHRILCIQHHLTLRRSPTPQKLAQTLMCFIWRRFPDMSSHSFGHVDSPMCRGLTRSQNLAAFRISCAAYKTPLQFPLRSPSLFLFTTVPCIVLLRCWVSVLPSLIDYSPQA